MNCFAIASGYLGLNAKHKFSSIIMLWAQIVFWGVVINLVFIIYSLCIGQTPNWLSLIKSVFPILSQQNWYFSCYFCLFFFAPIINKIINTITRTEAKNVIIISAGLFFLVETLIHDSSFAMNAGYSWVWLALMYFIGAYIKKYYNAVQVSIKKNLLIFLLCTGGTLLTHIGIAVLTNALTGTVSSATKFITYTSPLMVGMALALLNVFRSMKITESKGKVFTFISQLTFGVYIIHTNNAIFQRMYGILDFVNEYKLILTMSFVLIVSVIIFITCAIADYLRQLLFKLLHIKNLATRMDSALTKLISKINF